MMRLSKKDSFTIIETLMAIVLLAITIVAFFASTMASFSFLRRISELQTASLVLQDEVSNIREMEYLNIQSMGSNFTTSGMSSLHNAIGYIIKTSYGGEPNILKITIRVDWTAFDGSAASRSIVTLITDSGIDKR